MCDGRPHGKLRSNCKHCSERDHNHNKKYGKTGRFHGVGSYCKTHHNKRNPAVAVTCYGKKSLSAGQVIRNRRKLRGKTLYVSASSKRAYYS